MTFICFCWLFLLQNFTKLINYRRFFIKIHKIIEDIIKTKSFLIKLDQPNKKIDKIKRPNKIGFLLFFTLSTKLITKWKNISHLLTKAESSPAKIIPLLVPWSHFPKNLKINNLLQAKSHYTIDRIIIKKLSLSKKSSIRQSQFYHLHNAQHLNQYKKKTPSLKAVKRLYHNGNRNQTFSQKRNNKSQ